MVLLRATGVILFVAACGKLGIDPVPDGSSSDFCATATFATPPASSLSDDFSTIPFADDWTQNDTCMAQQVGELVATPSPGGSFCLAYTKAGYHLTCDSITVQVPEVTPPTVGVQTVIYLAASDNSHPVQLLLEGGGFELDAGADIIPTPGAYDPTNDRWWRLAEHDGDLSFLTSPDGMTWNVRGHGPVPRLFDDVSIVLGAGTWEAVATPGEAHFHCYNTPPPCN